MEEKKQQKNEGVKKKKKAAGTRKKDQERARYREWGEKPREIQMIERKLQQKNEGEVGMKRHEEIQRKMDEDARKKEMIRMEQLLELERQKKMAENARKEEEKMKKLEMKRKREENERRADPNNWTNIIVYDVESDRDSLGHGVVCVIRVPDDVTLEKSHVVCSVLETSVNRYQLEENEALVGNIVNMRPVNQNNGLKFRSGLWMAFPFISTSKPRETVIKHQQLQSESTHATDRVEWMEVPTREATIQRGKVKEQIRFVETELSHLSSAGINVVVVARPKTDRQIINSKGGELRSTIDERIAITVPENAFKNPTPVAIQAIEVDSNVVKERYDGFEQLLGSSSVVLVHCPAEPHKPLTFSFDSPSGFKGHIRHKTLSIDKRFSKASKRQYSLATTSMGVGDDAPSEDDEKDFVNLVTRDVNGIWRSRDEISLNVQKDSTFFEMRNLEERLLLLRTSKLLRDSELIKIAENLDQSLEDRLISILVRQNPTDISNIYVECCNHEVAPKTIESLIEHQPTQGLAPIKALIREGDLVEVSVTGEIQFEDNRPRLLSYHFNLASPKFFAGIKAMEGLDRNTLDHYQGMLQLRIVERAYKPPVKFLGSTVYDKGEKINSIIKDARLICKIPITLPKPLENLKGRRKILLPLPTEGPLTEEYLNHLSEELGEDWKTLAARLKISPASVQRISADHAHLMNAEATQRSARQMLGEWFRNSSKAEDKAEKLQWELSSAGRTDLADELGGLNLKYKQESERRRNHAVLMKCIKAYTDSRAAVKEWRRVGLALGFRDEDLEAISRSQVQGIIEQARTMLMTWIDVRGEKATKDLLIKCLKNLNLNEAARKVKLVV